MSISHLSTAMRWARVRKDHAMDMGLVLVRDMDLTHKALPFWTLGWQVARVVLLFPFVLRWYVLLSPQTRRLTAACFLSVATTAHAMHSGAAEYGILVFQKQRFMISI